MELVIPVSSFALLIVNSESGIDTSQLVQRFAVSEDNSFRAVTFVPF